MTTGRKVKEEKTVDQGSVNDHWQKGKRREELKLDIGKTA